MLKPLLSILACCAIYSCSPAFAAIDVNQADEAALTGVKGVGPAMAHRIVEERGKQGAFKDAADLATRVKGLGPKSVARLQREGLSIGKAPAAMPAKAAVAKKERSIPVARDGSGKSASGRMSGGMPH